MVELKVQFWESSRIYLMKREGKWKNLLISLWLAVIFSSFGVAVEISIEFYRCLEDIRLEMSSWFIARSIFSKVNEYFLPVFVIFIWNYISIGLSKMILISWSPIKTQPLLNSDLNLMSICCLNWYLLPDHPIASWLQGIWYHWAWIYLHQSASRSQPNSFRWPIYENRAFFDRAGKSKVCLTDHTSHKGPLPLKGGQDPH